MAFARSVLMIRPAAFGFNAETAVTNAFQRPSLAEDVGAAARREFDAAARALAGAGVDVHVFEDIPVPPRPDAVFPNNWLSTHPDGRVFLYPMQAPSRRAEVRYDLVDALRRSHEVREVIDWSGEAARGRFLEGTGSLVLDAARGRVLACRSPRTDPELAAAWAARMGLELVLFTARDPEGRPIYHTNVLLCVGDGFAACGLERIDPRERDAVADRLAEGRARIDLDDRQLAAFAGNLLQLRGAGGAPALALSTTALAALTGAPRRALERHTGLVPLEIPTIEAVGGGSARCMLAEIFLEPRGGQGSGA